jgi:methyl-accepting chemotaxis protein
MGWISGKKLEELTQALEENGQCQSILSNLPTPVMAIDKDFNVTFMNPTGAKVVGMTKEEVIGKKCYSLFNTAHCKTEECRCHQAMIDDAVVTGETTANPNGKSFPIQYTGAPIKDEAGNIIGAMEYVVDFTETRGALDDSAAKVNYLNNIPTPVMVVDTDFNVQFLNDAGAGALGRSSEECKGTKCYDLFKTTHCNTENCQVARAMKEDGTFTNDTVASLPSGQLPIRYTGTPLKNEGGTIVGALEYVLDLSKEMEITEELGGLVGSALEGNLSHRADADKFVGNYQKIVKGVNELLDTVLEPIGEAQDVLDLMAVGDLRGRMEGDYKGDNAKLKDALNNTLDSFEDILNQVANAVAQVSSGAEQVASASQSLSQGATEQAASLEEVSSSMTQVGSQTQLNAENAEQANTLSGAAHTTATQGNEHMREMLSAMTDINDKSAQVQKIIKVIDEIAFQTNLLALNAAVEAARAGVHGKGFAVVAEEVRNLAQRSAKAADETTELIESNVASVENGAKIAEQTAKALEEIVEGITKATDLVNEIASASKEQTQAVSEINDSLAQIDQVTQSNTASAEESAAAAEELSGQSVNLKEMISRFKLTRIESAAITPATPTSAERRVAEPRAEFKAQPQKSSKPEMMAPEMTDRRVKLVSSSQKVGSGRSTEKTPEEIIALDDADFSNF